MSFTSNEVSVGVGCILSFDIDSMTLQCNEYELYPCPSAEKLEELYVGKNLRDVPTPAAVIDRSVVQRNCKQMLDAVHRLQLGFRPHVKTHKARSIYSPISNYLMVS